MLPRPNPADIIVISDDEDAPLAALASRSAAMADEPRRKSRVTAAIPFADPSVIFDLDNLPDLRLVREAYHRDGYVVLRALDAAQCATHVVEQVKHILLQQPWKERLVVRCPRTGRVLDIDADRELYLQVLTSPNIPAKTLREWKEAWPFHRGFGACCDPASFWLPSMCAARQDPRIYAVASALLGRRDIWVDINRSIQKMPTEGEDEFLHWDLSPFADDVNWDECRALHGKMAATKSRVVVVPATATEKFRTSFVDAYRAHYPNAKPSDAKFGLDRSKPDPLHLLDRRVAIEVPAGCLVFWKPELCHGVRKKQADEAIEFGFYLGFHAPRPSELPDRVAAYREGRAPQFWPSRDRVHYFPFR